MFLDTSSATMNPLNRYDSTIEKLKGLIDLNKQFDNEENHIKKKKS